MDALLMTQSKEQCPDWLKPKEEMPENTILVSLTWSDNGHIDLLESIASKVLVINEDRTAIFCLIDKEVLAKNAQSLPRPPGS